MSSIRYTNFNGLLNVGSSDFLLESSELSECKNVYAYKLGKLEKVPGYSKAGSSQIDTDTANVFLHYYQNSASLTDYLIGGTPDTLKYRTTGDWASLTGTNNYTEGMELSAENYLDKVFLVSAESPYTTAYFRPMATINGTTFTQSPVTDTDLTDAPEGRYIVRYRDLLYVLNCNIGTTIYPSRAYYCDEPTAGAITWDNTNNFVEFGFDDGDYITGGAEAFDRLVVFKQFSMWQYDESRREKVADIGCDSNRSVQKVNGNLYWYNRGGIYMWTGGIPVLISNKVQEYIDAIDQTTIGGIFAVEDGFEYKLFIGDVTVNGISYTNTWICYDTRRQTFYIRCTADTAYSATKYVESGKERTYFGGTGYVYRLAKKIDEVYDDDGDPIDSFFTTKNLDFGIPEDKKFSQRMTVFSRNCQGVNVSVDVDNNGTFRDTKSQVIKKNVDSLNISTSGNRFRYKFYENSSNKSWSFEGFTIETDINEKKI